MSTKNSKKPQISGMKLVSYGGKYASSGRSGRSEKQGASQKTRLLLLIPVAAVVLIAILIPILLDNSGRYTLEETGHQYYAGSKTTVTGGSQLKQDAEGNTQILVDGKEAGSTDLPIYFKDSSSVVIPGEMIYYAPRKGIFAKTDLFSEVAVTESGAVRIQKESQNAAVDQGFLYNGEDFYLFLEPMVLEFNGYRLELPALSYVEARFDGDVMVFRYDTEEFLMEPPKDAVIASTPAGDYTISLLNDSMTLHDGSRMLLFTRPDLLGSVQELEEN